MTKFQGKKMKSIDTSTELSLQLTFESEASVLQSPDHPHMPALRIAFSHADRETRFFSSWAIDA